ncbi:amidohydrolase/deacetylase family metallohydrolase [Olivibacter sp. XZL3]|uniref:amidohydrolase/deacetylase family metallohydrolase n=1 Tax=Olivibacter sp. XZL3 TaxID=1735116 RepID=UPI001064FC9E|nr:amidohydrolase/deacetylase family metallohydrolase [Olivibacter sp. XZL3]
MYKKIVLFIVFGLFHSLLFAQEYAILIKGGHVIDPKNGIDAIMDIAIAEGKIVKIAKQIDAKATQIVDASNLYVTPGLIDIHAHHFFGTEPHSYLRNSFTAIPPDGFTFRNGVTTVVDAGSPGWRNFQLYKDQTIDHSKTRVLAFLNIIGEGMRGGAYEQDLKDTDPKMAALVAKQFRPYIVGFKVAHFEGPDWTVVDHAVEAGKLAGDLPVMVDFGGSTPPLPLSELLLNHLRKGDILTHCFAQINGRESIVDPNQKKVKAFAREARKQGRYFDVGYGGISFSFSQAVPAIKEGFYPDAISTDIHMGSVNNAMKDMLNVASKCLVMGMSLQQVIAASTWQPAQIIKRPELGHLSVGAEADIAILALQEGNFGYFDYTGYKINGKQKLACEMTVRAGEIVYDLNGIAEPIVVANKRKEH